MRLGLSLKSMYVCIRFVIQGLKGFIRVSWGLAGMVMVWIVRVW